MPYADHLVENLALSSGSMAGRLQRSLGLSLYAVNTFEIGADAVARKVVASDNQETILTAGDEMMAQSFAVAEVVAGHGACCSFAADCNDSFVK